VGRAVYAFLGGGLGRFAAGLSDAGLRSLSFQSVSLSIALPRFTSSYSSALSPALTSLGMGIAFTQSADFSALAPGAFVSEVYHATVVEVDETGTVAAAATRVGVTTSDAGTGMTMDHPFIWAIEDGRTGELVFIGILADPAAALMG